MWLCTPVIWFEAFLDYFGRNVKFWEYYFFLAVVSVVDSQSAIRGLKVKLAKNNKGGQQRKEVVFGKSLIISPTIFVQLQNIWFVSSEYKV